MQRVVVIDEQGVVATLAGSGTYGASGIGGPASQVELANPTDVAVDRAGSIYIADTHNHRVLKVGGGNRVIQYVGNGIRGSGVLGGGAQSVMLSSPSGLYVDANRSLYIADQGNHRILRVDVDGTVTRVAGTGEQGHGLPDGHLGRCLRTPTDRGPRKP